jgi:hypothetical protein
MDKPFAHSDIPLSSTLTVTLSGTGTANQQTFSGTGRLELPDGSVEPPWTNAELRGGLSRKLQSSGTYSGRVDINFAKQATARLQISLTSPGGQQIATYDESVTQASDFDRTQLLLVVNAAQTGLAAPALVSVAAQPALPAPPAPPAQKVAKKAAKKAAKKPVKAAKKVKKVEP